MLSKDQWPVFIGVSLSFVLLFFLAPILMLLLGIFTIWWLLKEINIKFERRKHPQDGVHDVESEKID